MPDTLKNSCKYCTALEYHNGKYRCKLDYKIESIIYLDNSFKAIPLDLNNDPPPLPTWRRFNQAPPQRRLI
jgi:hypothetical protein